MMLRNLTILGLLLSLLAGCSPSPRERLESACRAEGQTEALCSCIVTSLEESLEPELFKRTAVAIGREKRDIADYIRALPEDEQLAFGAALSGMFACAITEEDR